MARTWRNERTTPKKPPVQAPVRPRMDEFAREYYQGLGYTPEIPQDDTMTALEEENYLEYLEPEISRMDMDWYEMSRMEMDWHGD